MGITDTDNSLSLKNAKKYLQILEPFHENDLTHDIIGLKEFFYHEKILRKWKKTTIEIIELSFNSAVSLTMLILTLQCQ